MNITLQKCRLEKIAKSVVNILFEWQSERGSQQFFRDASIPSFHNHEKWFDRRIRQKPLYFWKIKCSKSQNCFEFLGFIRLDKLISANSFEISVFIANKFKKKELQRNSWHLHAKILVI